MDLEIEVNDKRHVVDWHVLLIMYKHTQYCWPIIYRYWETDLSMKTKRGRFKSRWTMLSRSRTNVMWLVDNFISRTISTLTWVIQAYYFQRYRAFKKTNAAAAVTAGKKHLCLAFATSSQARQKLRGLLEYPRRPCPRLQPYLSN